MCGLVGQSGPWDHDLVERGLDLIAHRGPDARETIVDGDVRHGHVRLALVDLDHRSDQPFRRGNGLLSFNGEIWNWRELREELRHAGERFTTESDTEVLAAALNRWGAAETLTRAEGMFAFAWSRGDDAILARDRFGKVPLYVHRSGDRFAWASERKALPGLACTALPPASILDLRTGYVSRWYELPERGEANAPVHLLLETGVERRLLADAPLCCLISGGLDSSLILTLAKRHKPDVVAFTAALEDSDSRDLKAARRLCGELEVPLEEVRVKTPTRASLAAAARAIETPMKAQVEIAALCLPLAEAIRANGFKACLSGEAADELFGGYGSMCIKGSSADDAGWRAIRVQQLQKMARGNFIRCNLAFMAHGVECRLPFMERSLVESVLAMSKAECPPGKKLLKAEALQAGVPQWCIKRVKDTFQGGAGLDVAAASVLANPAAFYRAEVRNAYGESAVAKA